MANLGGSCCRRAVGSDEWRVVLRAHALGADPEVVDGDHREHLVVLSEPDARGALFVLGEDVVLAICDFDVASCDRNQLVASPRGEHRLDVGADVALVVARPERGDHAEVRKADPQVNLRGRDAALSPRIDTGHARNRRGRASARGATPSGR